MSKRVTFGKQGMDKMIKGLNIVADCVAGTIGPKGLNVYFSDAITPSIINDGVKIANKIVLEDPEEDLGAYVVRNVSGEQLDSVGDGTTTAVVLLQSIIHECLKRPENPMEVKASLKEAGDKVLKILAKKSIKLKKEDIYKVALISSEDETIAKLITEIIEKLGEKAVVNVEDSKTFKTEYEIVDGYEANVGFMSPHFITNHKSSNAVFEDISVLIYDKKISNLTDIAPVFELIKKENLGQICIICQDIDDSMLGVFVNSKAMGAFSGVVIRATDWLLHDIEGATGAKAISPQTGVTPQNFKKEYFGKAKKIVCTANTTLFTTDGVASKQYAKWLEMEAENDPNQYQAKKLKERAAKLRGGIAVLKIAASTDQERIYLREKADDAVKATKAAIEEGICEGGGMTLWRIAKELNGKSIGEQILKKSLQAPLRKIIENAGQDYSEIVEEFDELLGYDAKTDIVVPLIQQGIIDPIKVERCAVENAVSAAGTFVTSFCLITDLPEEGKK
jgi:chaperonin GroEL